MKKPSVVCFIWSGALPLVPENCQVGDCPPEHCTCVVVDAVWVLPTDGSNGLNEIPPGLLLKVHAASALTVAPESNANNRQDVFQRQWVGIDSIMASAPSKDLQAWFSSQRLFWFHRNRSCLKVTP
jgi:hypothetical protein